MYLYYVLVGAINRAHWSHCSVYTKLHNTEMLRNSPIASQFYHILLVSQFRQIRILSQFCYFRIYSQFYHIRILNTVVPYSHNFTVMPHSVTFTFLPHSHTFTVLPHPHSLIILPRSLTRIYKLNCPSSTQCVLHFSLRGFLLQTIFLLQSPFNKLRSR
jgi:hypothetical protein